jgi:hypothetical protein
MAVLNVEFSTTGGWHLTCDGDPVTLPEGCEGELSLENPDIEPINTESRVKKPKRLRLVVDVIFPVDDN